MKTSVIVMCMLGLISCTEQTGAAALSLDLSIETIYQDGEKGVEQRTETYEAMEDFFADYKNWQIIDMNQDMITLRTTEETLSPLVKWSGYADVD
ncbi:BofC N-terminal domain-containing protein [Jeotgalibacillus haloalkalitolerans]|uniref:BofC N-terminal domain-containing protein n=1 Tax=Jeotgalibacillus haloalkalitolerans TaxID=3104292 RepID=A0ABU5KM61_9BACL|nr:BofC N-terminal domain-containing protein [Jeotgalibacillus sp. HH7-29]MDZ5712341.1 BofC N-terminal domain-containing protein [Jeotgalibacillus sp. HH7-29]